MFFLLFNSHPGVPPFVVRERPTSGCKPGLDEIPKGVIPKYKPRDPKHRKLLVGNEDVPWLASTFTNAVWLENRPDARTALREADQGLILANVEEDDLLLGRTTKDEIERVEAIQPEYYIPSDRWVYDESMTAREQIDQIDRSLWGTRKVTNYVRSDPTLGTKIIPLAKGWEPWHFERSRAVFEKLGFAYCAFDVTQYKSSDRVVADVSTLIDVIEPTGVLLIGRLSPSTLHECPPEVVAATGVNQWLTRCKTTDGVFKRTLYSEWTEIGNKALNSVQTGLDEFQKESDEQASINQFYQQHEVNMHG